MDFRLILKKTKRILGVFFCIINVLFAENTTKQKFQSILDGAKVKFEINAISLSILLPGKQKPENFLVGTKSILNKLPINKSTVFKVGSITKTYTAVLITKAIAEGKLKLSDKLNQLLPEYPKWKHITVKELINQTSGVADYVLVHNWWKNLMANKDKVWTFKELAKLAYDAQERFPSDQKWHYSNTNYILLGMILEKIYHAPVQKLMTQLIQQVGLKYTYYYPRPYSHDIYSQMVHGYFQNQYDETKLNGSWSRTAGAILSTPTDMVKWMHALFTNHSLKGLPISRFFSFANAGESFHIYHASLSENYSVGIFKSITVYGLIYYVPGLAPGYTSMMAYVPCYNVYFAYSANKSPILGFHNFMLSKIIAALAHGSKTYKVGCHKGSFLNQVR
ncbi:serine hydrolase domain-containing protein [Cysteiniphilum sp. 6C5]|uniref:serine hydrolase domain-containing protein n=1 Tax=unclassified Cysteiniphilum TaxID=2610889 RepID=UPI003F83B731